MQLDLDPGIIDACHTAAQKVVSDVSTQIEGKTTMSIERATKRMLAVGGGDVEMALGTIGTRQMERRDWREDPEGEHSPLRYVLTATGDIDQDVTHALAVCEAGGDIIAMIRSTGQSLLDYVPEHAKTGGTGGTFNNQENFRIMRRALDEWSEQHGRYIRLSGFASGLCQPEIAAIGAIEGLDNMVCDGLYGCLYRDLNIERVLIDTRFARLICGWAGIVINTGEDNYLRTAEGLEAAHTVTASQFINYYLAREAGVPASQVALGDAFELDPGIENSLLYQIAQAQLTRQLWPDCPVKYMPPTRHEDGDFYFTHARDVLFGLVATMTNQGIVTIGVPSEGLHTPHISDRVTALKTLDYVHRAAGGLSDELEIKDGGIIAERARDVLLLAHDLLECVAEWGLFHAIEQGTFGDVKRKRDGGKGREGIIEKAEDYSNPVEELMMDACRA